MSCSRFILILGVAGLLAGCRGNRIRDRHDELALIQAEEHHNLYRRKGIDLPNETSGQSRIPGTPAPAPPPGQALYAYGQAGLVRESELAAPLAADPQLATIAIGWGTQPPVLRFWQRLNRRSVAFVCPLDAYNTRPVATADPAAPNEFAVFVSLRQGTLMPWIIEDDYELFQIRVRQRAEAEGGWEILAVEQLTDNRQDDVQPVLDARRNRLAWTVLDGKTPQIRLRDLATGTETVVAETATLPFFLADGDGLMLVQEADGMREFRIFEPATGTLRPAREEELAVTLSLLPHSRLKARYLLAHEFGGSATRGSAEPEVASCRVEDLMMAGLQQAPVILRDFRKLNGAASETKVGLVNEGPEFFFSANHLTDEYLLVEEDPNAVAVGDRATQENFLRLLTGMSIPVIPNIPLRMAIYDSNLWQEEVYRQRFHRTVNEFIADLTVAILDLAEGEAGQPRLHRTVALNERRLETFRRQVALGEALPDRILFAENTLAAARTDLEQAIGKMIVARARIVGLLGWSPERDFQLAPIQLDGTPPPLPSPEWFEAQGRINHPDLQRLNFMIMRAAAIRDLGPPATRNDGVKIRITYGLGIDHWSEAVDDFISLSTDHVIPIRLPLLDNAYYDQWTAELDHFRQEKFRTQGEVTATIQAAHLDLTVLLGQLDTRTRRRDFYRERLRVSRLRDQLGHPGKEARRKVFTSIEHELAWLAEERAVLGDRAEAHRRLAKLHAAAGIAPRLLPELFAQLDGVAPAREVHGLYLWRSQETVTDRDQRQAFLDFCAANQVDLVYCFVSRTPGEAPDLVRLKLEFAYFLERCHRQGIRVVALMGEPAWLEPSSRPEIQAQLEAWATFNLARAAADEPGFVGIKLDVEPHADPAWAEPKGRQALIANYLSLLDEVSSRVGREQLSVDLPWNWQGLPVADRDADLLAAVAARVQRLTVMAYLTPPGRMIERVLPILQRDDLALPIEIALETGPVAEPGVSYHGQPRAAVLAAMAEARQAFASATRFAGFIIHDYHHFREMTDEAPPPPMAPQ